MSKLPPRRPRQNDLRLRMMGEIKPFHSSAFAEAASGDRIGAAAVSPFSKRRQVDSSRKVVPGYRDALLAQVPAGTRQFGCQPSTNREGPARPQAPERPTCARSAQPFREPPTRGYNPFG